MNLAPGDPVTAMIDPQQGSGGLDMDAVREQLGLNKPLPVRYLIWLREVVRGNFGYSYTTGQPVTAAHRRARAGDRRAHGRRAGLLDGGRLRAGHRLGAATATASGITC